MKIKKESNNNHIIKPSGNLSRIHKYKIWRWVIITRYSIFQNKISYKFVFTIWNDWNIFEQIFQAAANMYKKFKILIFSLFFFQFWLFFFLIFSSGFPKIPNLSNSLNIQKVTVVRKINAMNKKSYCMYFMHKGSNHVIISFFLNIIKCFFETNVFWQVLSWKTKTTILPYCDDSFQYCSFYLHVN